MSEEGDVPVCIICKLQDGTHTAKLEEKGCQSLIIAARNKGAIPDQVVHSECRRQYCHPNQSRQVKISEHKSSTPQKTRKSYENRFRFDTSCIFCGTDAKENEKRGQDVYLVRTLEFQKTIKENCEKRNDTWGETVLGRIEFAQDLPAVEARYHQSCSINVRTGFDIPQQLNSSPGSKKLSKGRLSNSYAEKAFVEVIIPYLERNETEQLILTDLVNKMKKLCGNEAYSCTYMKKKIQDHFGEAIVIVF